jgi:hypothetical protein
MKVRRRVVTALAIALCLAGWPAPRLFAQGGGGPKTTNGSVSFKVNCKGGIIDQEIRATLTVEKPGKTPLVNATPPPAGQVDGNHNFPAGTTAGGVGAYYKGLLANNGWKENTDFKVDGGTITFFGISKLDGGTNHQHLVVDGSTDSKDVPYTPVTPAEPPKKTIGMTRGERGMAGTVTLVGFGLHWSPGQPASSSTAVLTVPFGAESSAAEVLAGLADALVAAGWQASLNALGEVEIARTPAGDPVYSLHHRIEYLPGATPDADQAGNEDHWIFTLAPDLTDVSIER